MSLILMMPVLFAAAGVWQCMAMRSTKDDPGRQQQIKWIVLAGLLIALVVRGAIAWHATGFRVDMGTFMGWAERVVEVGFADFYAEDVFADYSPGYIYVLYLLGKLRQLYDLGFQSNANYLLIKLPAILADITSAAIIYQYGKKRVGEAAAAGLALIYAFNPATFINSAFWGQVDAFYALFLLISIIAAAKLRVELASILFAVAVLIKPQALIFTPVLLLTLLYVRSWKRFGLSAIYGLSTLLIGAAPFFDDSSGIRGLIGLYEETLSSYSYGSVNAYNLMALLGHNWTRLNLTMDVYGMLIIILAVAAAVLIYVWGRKNGYLADLFLIGAILIAVMFVLGIKMHERYMFPGMLLLLFSYLQLQDRRLLYLFYGFSLTQFINVANVLRLSAEGIIHQRWSGVMWMTSLANVLLLGYLLYVGYDLYYRNRVKDCVRI